MTFAKDIMTKTVHTIKENTSIIEAIILLVEKKVAGLPVLNEKDDIIGIITEKDILDLATKGCKDPSIKVSEFVNRKIITYTKDTNLSEIADTFKRQSFRMIPIVENKKLLGVIARRDIIHYILNKAFDLNS